MPDGNHNQVGQLGAQALMGTPPRKVICCSVLSSVPGRIWVIQTFMRSLVISLNIAWVNSVLANQTFVQTRVQLAASELQALQDSPDLFCMTFRAVQQLARKPSIQKSVWILGKTITEALGALNDHELWASLTQHCFSRSKRY